MWSEEITVTLCTIFGTYHQQALLMWSVVPQARIKARKNKYIPQYLWDVVTSPCPWYLVLAQHSWFVPFTDEYIIRFLLKLFIWFQFYQGEFISQYGNTDRAEFTELFDCLTKYWMIFEKCSQFVAWGVIEITWQLCITDASLVRMMTSWNGNIFRVTGHLCGEFTGHRWIPHTKASDAELWCFHWSAPE